jgi:hypothetical protein
MEVSYLWPKPPLAERKLSPQVPMNMTETFGRVGALEMVWENGAE